MKIQNMTNNNGNKTVNQFIISDAIIEMPNDTYKGELFQSYNSVIAFIAYHCNNTGNCHSVFLDNNKWDYSNTTGKYRNIFLNETKKETQAKINSGEYTLTNLNL